jgi:hypothetical protein
LIKLTVGILKCCKSVASKFDRLLEEHWGKSVHGDVKSETDESEDRKQDSDGRKCHKEWNRCNSAL